MRTRKTLEERYWAKVTVRGPDECWLWNAALGGSPYGMLWDGTFRDQGGPHMVISTRIGYVLRVGPIPLGLSVLHHCDTPPCHNDIHWFLGTSAYNNRDRQAKGRTVLPNNAGERHGLARLTASQVVEVRNRYVVGDIKQSTLAAEYGVCQQQISRIVRGTSWG
jgi:hypothetical protein